MLKKLNQLKLTNENVRQLGRTSVALKQRGTNGKSSRDLLAVQSKG